MNNLSLALWSIAGLLIVSAARDREEAAVNVSRSDVREYLVIPGARVRELTQANGYPRRKDLLSWSRSHGDAGNMRYSPLNQINVSNVKDLQIAWTYRSADGNANIQCNPVIVDGVMYAPTAGDYIVAVNAGTGHEIWRFKPEGRPAQRGLVYWRGFRNTRPRIYFISGRYLHALDAKTGQAAEGFGQAGRVPLSSDALPAGIGVVAPAIVKDVIVAPYMNIVMGMRVDSGEMLWRFDLLPQDGQFGRETWSARERGVHVWGGIALDEQRGIVYASTGSPHPNMVGIHHTGRNLFANCVVALDAKSGKRLWHFQEIRHDIWDLDIPAPPVLVTLQRENKRVDAVAQVTKMGNTLLLDRVTGAPLFPFRLRRAPESKLAGEKTWPYQPDLELPQPFARQVFTLDHVTDISPKSRQHVLAQIANANYGWFEPFEPEKPTVFYGIHGGAEWTGASFDPQTGWLYVSSNEIPWIITVNESKAVERDPKAPATLEQKVYLSKCAACHGAKLEGSGMAPPLVNLTARYDDASMRALISRGKNAMPPIKMAEAEMGGLLKYLFGRDVSANPEKPAPTRTRYGFSGFNKLQDQDGYPGSRPPWGTLNAIDLNNGKLMWKVPLGEYQELMLRGLPPTGTENFGGATVTAGGLVFCAGTRDHKIRAFDKTTGKELWQHPLPFGGYAPPAVYSFRGKQYIVIAATGGGKLGDTTGDAYVAFALPGNK
jgi:quinoprotein glucose dehydrogenase